MINEVLKIIRSMALTKAIERKVSNIFKEEFKRSYSVFDNVDERNIPVDQIKVVALSKALSKIAYEHNIMEGRLSLLLSDDVSWDKYKLRLNEISLLMKEKGL